MASFFGGSSTPKPKPVAPPSDTSASERQAALLKQRRGTLGQSTNLSQFRGSQMSEMYSSGKESFGSG